MTSLATTQAVAPGKLILAGEHAVVYGHPALVMAINRYVKTSIQPQAEPQITFYFPELEKKQSVSLVAVRQLHERIQQNYQAFLKGELDISEVLRNPIELVQFALSLLLEATQIPLLTGIQINLQTDLPIGCGMGSSAAAVISILAALIQYLQVTVSPELLFELAYQAENMQHGKSSGLDVKSSLHGGCLYLKAGQMQSRIPPKLPLYLINTGQPKTNTGECVAAAAVYFQKTNIGTDFAAVTDALDAALQFNKLDEVIFAVRENHRLLNTIGVVPQKVQQFIAEIENNGGAAKVSGAGAVVGDNAGAVLVVMEDRKALQKIVERYQCEISLIQCEERGVYLQG